MPPTSISRKIAFAMAAKMEEGPRPSVCRSVGRDLTRWLAHHVAKVVPGIRQKRRGVSEQAENNLDHHEA